MLVFGANAHSTEHSDGVEAQEAIDKAGSEILKALGQSRRSICFTPGASAALWLAVEDCIFRTAGRLPQISASAAEHPALLSALGQAERAGRIIFETLPVDHCGLVRMDAVEAALDRGVDLLCTMAANNEVGTVTNVTAIREMARRAGARHLVDASQAAGKIDIADTMDADLIVLSGAKIYGPRRTGALIGELHGGAADWAHGLFGSPDTPSAIALAFAVQLRAEESEFDEARIRCLRDNLQCRLMTAVPGLLVNGADAERIAGSLHISSPHIPGDAVVSRLWGALAVSTGAACQSGAQAPSHVLTAMGLPDWAREGAVRVGIGRFNTSEDVDRAVELLAPALNAQAPARRVA